MRPIRAVLNHTQNMFFQKKEIEKRIHKKTLYENKSYYIHVFCIISKNNGERAILHK